jgi:hypothetical protein
LSAELLAVAEDYAVGRGNRLSEGMASGGMLGVF